MGVPVGQSSRRGWCAGTGARVWTDTRALHHVRTTTTSATEFKSTVWVTSFGALAAGQMMAGRDDGGVASRRDRQLRLLLRHEQLTVRMELAAALHQSAQPAGPVVQGPREQEVHELDASRGLKRPPLGTRRGVLKEPEAQWASTVGYVAAGAPHLVVPSLAGGEDVDGTTVSYLLEVAFT